MLSHAILKHLPTQGWAGTKNRPLHFLLIPAHVHVSSTHTFTNVHVYVRTWPRTCAGSCTCVRAFTWIIVSCWARVIRSKEHICWVNMTKRITSWSDLFFSQFISSHSAGSRNVMSSLSLTRESSQTTSRQPVSGAGWTLLNILPCYWHSGSECADILVREWVIKLLYCHYCLRMRMTLPVHWVNALYMSNSQYTNEGIIQQKNTGFILVGYELFLVSISPN